MKLLIVTSLKECQDEVARIFEQAKISVFSVSDTYGFKEDNLPNLMDSWFATGTEHFESIFLFSFTEEHKAELAMKLIKDHNASEEVEFPVRAFIVAVEKSSY